MAVIATLVISVVSFYQCTNNEDLFKGFQHEPDFVTLQEVHDQLTQNDTVYFSINDPETDFDFEAPQHIRLHFPVGSCSNGSTALQAPYKFKMIEIFKRGEIVRHNMQTFTNQNPLVSGGIFWLSGTDANGVPLTFNGVTAFIPYKTDAVDYEGNMAYFIGQTQTKPSGIVNSWTTATANVTFDPAVAPNGEFTLSQATSGWNSIQASYDFDLAGEEPSQFSVQVDNSPNFEKTEVFYTNNNFTIVQALTSVTGDTIGTFSGSVAKGSSGKLIVIALIDGKLNFGMQEVSIAGDDVFNITVNEGDLTGLATLLGSIN